MHGEYDTPCEAISFGCVSFPMSFLLLSLNLCHCVVVTASSSEKLPHWEVNVKDGEWGW